MLRTTSKVTGVPAPAGTALMDTASDRPTAHHRSDGTRSINPPAEALAVITAQG